MPESSQEQFPASNAINYYVALTILAGAAIFIYAAATLPVDSLDTRFLILAGCTILLASRVLIRIPTIKSHIAVSDIFVYLTLLLFGGEAAILLSAVDTFFSALRFCKKYRTILFNTAALTISTAVVYGVLVISGLYSEPQLHGQAPYFRDFLLALSLMALTQFAVNTVLASLYDSLKQGTPLLETWSSRYLWSFITYVVGAAGAGLLVQLVDYAGFFVAVLAFPILLFIYFSYRMYMRNVEMSSEQAEQAREYAKMIEERSEALTESEERFRSAFDNAPIGIALVKPGGELLKVNTALCEMLGYRPDELRERSVRQIFFEDDLPNVFYRVGEVASGAIASHQMEQRCRNSRGETVWTLWSMSLAAADVSKSREIIFQMQDITGRKAAEEKLVHEATHDPLTGLPNRNCFHQKLTEALHRSQRIKDHRTSVLFIDLDRFKYVNDSLGHIVGDQLLIGISNRLKNSIRPSDLVARLGGDEFTVLVEGDYDDLEIAGMAERIQRSLANPFNLRGHVVYSSASIGILHASDRHERAEDMMRDADTAMYHAKKSGKARYEIFNDSMHAEARETLKLETDLRQAIKDGNIEVCYQPLFSLTDRELTGFEALARWQHPELGEISPARFIPLAEEIGWIDTLGENILRSACKHIRSIHRKFPNYAHTKVNVNLSSQQFRSTGLVSRIQLLLSQTGFSPERLRLEITESVFFEHQDRAISMLAQLRDLGVEIDIDDFGTGYSNLSYLVRLPISRLKIDKSFVQMIREDGSNTEIVRTIIALARNLDLGVVAEGIEHEYQITALRTLGCDSGQGYLFSTPLRPDKLADFVADCDRGLIGGTEVPEYAHILTVQ